MIFMIKIINLLKNFKEQKKIKYLMKGLRN